MVTGKLLWDWWAFKKPVEQRECVALMQAFPLELPVTAKVTALRGRPADRPRRLLNASFPCGAEPMRLWHHL